MRKLLLFALVFGVGLAAWAQAWDTMAVAITITACPEMIDVPPSLSIQVQRLTEAVSNELILYYTTDYYGRDITVGVHSVSGTIPTNFRMFITTKANPGPNDWLEIDLDPEDGYAAVTLFQDVNPDEYATLSFWIKADAKSVGSGYVGASFTIVLKFTLSS